MTEAIWNALRRLLVDDYSSLKQRLARRFGSADFASEVLHEAWMRLGRVDTSSSTAAVHNPKAYLYRIALNVATDRQRADKSWLDKIEIETLYRRAHEDLDPGVSWKRVWSSMRLPRRLTNYRRAGEPSSFPHALNTCHTKKLLSSMGSPCGSSTEN